MRTDKQVRDIIALTKEANKHILRGEFAEVTTSTVKALMQLEVESKLQTLYWFIRKENMMIED